MLRYRTRDVTRVTRERCDCGRTHVRILRVAGRSDDMLIIRGVNVYPSQIESVLVGRPGLAPHYQLVVERIGRDRWRARLHDGPKVCYQRPSADVLMQSVARAAGAQSLGIILTGMGKDGAEGLLAMRRAGAQTIAQDEATSVVYGMPKEAVRLGAAERVLPLHRIGDAIAAWCCASAGTAVSASCRGW